MELTWRHASQQQVLWKSAGAARKVGAPPQHASGLDEESLRLRREAHEAMDPRRAERSLQLALETKRHAIEKSRYKTSKDEAQLAGGDLWLARANHLVDGQAKVAVQAHPEVPDMVWRSAEHAFTEARHVLMLAGSVCPLWPRLQRSERVEAPPPKPRIQLTAGSRNKKFPI